MIPGSGRSPGEGNGNPLQDSCLESPVDRETRQASVYVVARVRHGIATKPPPPPGIFADFYFLLLRLGFPGSANGKESACNAGDPGLIPGWGRSAREGIGYPFQYSWASLVAQLLKNPPAMWETWI